MSKKILVVEDNELNRKLLVDILENLGYEVTQAQDGEIALNLLTNNHFDLVLLDIQLPKISGYEVMKQMPNKVPTIVVSACCMADEISIAKDSGCLDYITKPVNVSEFVKKINTYLPLE